MLIEDMSIENYHAHPALSKTNLDWIARSPMHFKYYLDNPPKPTPAMIKGSAFHMATLEPDKFKENVVVWEGAKRGRAWEEFEETHGDKLIITDKEANDIQAMAEAVQNYPAFGMLMNSNTMTEVSIFMELMGVPCKIRPDVYFSDRYILLDLKSTANASPETFSRDTYNFRYHVQAAMYIDGVLAEGLASRPPPFILF